MDGVGANAAPQSDNPNGTVGLHEKSSASKQTVDVLPSLRLSFHLRHSLGGYTWALPRVSMTKAWRLQPHEPRHQIPQECL
jgi:hypothetical protein